MNPRCEMSADDQRDRYPRKAPHTKQLLAIQSRLEYGSTKPPARATTASEAAPAAIDPASERSTRVELDGPGIGQTVARMEERQKDERDERRGADLAIATAVGDVKLGLVKLEATTDLRLGEMVRLMEKNDLREDEREKRQSEERKTARAGRKEIILAVIGLLGLVAGAYGLGTRAAAPGAQIQMTAPAAPPAVQR